MQSHFGPSFSDGTAECRAEMPQMMIPGMVPVMMVPVMVPQAPVSMPVPFVCGGGVPMGSYLPFSQAMSPAASSSYCFAVSEASSSDECGTSVAGSDQPFGAKSSRKTAQSEESTTASEWSSVRCAELLDLVAAGESAQVLGAVLPSIVGASLDEHGCHVVQRLIETVDVASCAEILHALAPSTQTLFESKHGNHVLCKLVETIPSNLLQPVIERVEQIGVCRMGRHKFGGRVLERLIEHCTEGLLASVLDQLVADMKKLAVHKLGNYIAKSVIEHAGESRRNDILGLLLPGLPALAIHRMGSPVLQKLMHYCTGEGQQAIAEALVNSTSPSLADMAANRYGSYVVEELPLLRFPGATRMLQTARDRLAEASLEQASSQFFPRAAMRVGLVVGIPTERSDLSSETDDE